MAGKRVGVESMTELPESVVGGLNDLGFGLCDGDAPYTFARFMTNGEARLLIQQVERDRWRIGLSFRAADTPGKLPNPFVAVPLGEFGSSSDGTTLEVTTPELEEELLHALEAGILPRWDLPW